MTKPFEHFGAVATPMPTPECYMALDRGILDAMLVPAQFAVGMKFYEVVKYGIKQPVVVGAPPVLMSKKVWNDLPVDIQLQVNQAIAEFVYDQLEYWQPKWDESLSKMEQNGVEIYEFNASEWAKLEEMAGPVVDEWVAETEAKGLPARAMAERMQTIAARYK